MKIRAPSSSLAARRISPWRFVFAVFFATAGNVATIPAAEPSAQQSTEEDKPTPAAPVSMSDVLSRRLALAVRMGLPRYGSDQSLTVRVDQPSPEEYDDIVKLPDLVVREAKAPTFQERETLTNKGLASYLDESYPGARTPGLDPLSKTMSNYALLMLHDDIRMEQITEFTSFAAVLRRTDNSLESKSLEKEIDRTFIRPHDSETESLDKSANAYRR
jgi:hypothetical protein